MVRQYVGARYVPKFMGLYDATTIYEGLCVVDNGLGTSYIAKKTVPAGTALTNTEYWAVYGSTSGAIIDLQERMNEAENDIEALDSKIDKENRVSPSGTLMIGHAGASELAPPNTIAGFELACILDADGIEADVFITSDNVLVCSHNNATSYGNIRENTFATVNTWAVSGSYSTKFNSDIQTIPAFTDFLAICKSNNKIPFIELKWEEEGHLTVEELQHVYNAVKAYGLEKKAVIASWITEPLVAYKELDPTSTTIRLLDYTLGESTTAMIDAIKALGIDGVGVEGYSGADTLIKYAHSQGMLAEAFTINSYNSILHSIFASSPDFILTGSIINIGDLYNPYSANKNYKLFSKDGFPCVSKFFVNASSKFPRYGNNVSRLTSVPDLVHRWTLDISSLQRAYTFHGYKKVGDALNYNIPTGYRAIVVIYALNADFIAESAWLSGEGKYIIENAGFTFVMYAKNPDAVMDYWELVGLIGCVEDTVANGAFGSETVQGTSAGYVTTSGNYISFEVPLRIDSSKTSVSITSYDANNSAFVYNNTRASFASIVDSINVLTVKKNTVIFEAHLSSPMTPDINGTVIYNMVLSIS